ncbi:MAG: DUF882 domain-containing protein [Elusimicrobiales bacterium]
MKTNLLRPLVVVALAACAPCAAGDYAVDFRPPERQGEPVKTDNAAYSFHRPQDNAQQQPPQQRDMQPQKAAELSTGTALRNGPQVTRNDSGTEQASSSGAQGSAPEGREFSEPKFASEERTDSSPAMGDLPGATASSGAGSSGGGAPGAGGGEEAQTPKPDDKAVQLKTLDEVTSNLMASYGPKGLVNKGAFKDEKEAKEYAEDLLDDARQGGGGGGGDGGDTSGGSGGGIEEASAGKSGGGKSDPKLESKMGKIKQFTITSSHGSGSVTIKVNNGKVDSSSMGQVKKVFRCRLTKQEHDIPQKLIQLIGAVAAESSGSKGGNVKVTLNSGYRSPKLNSMVGGASQSQHMKGNAADIQVQGASADKMYQACVKLKAGGCGKYSSFAHVDVGPVRTWGGK